jgi:type VI secretion system protein ImpG
VPTLPLYPPLVGGYEWHLISHLALNYLSLTKPETLRSILELYEWNVEGSTKNANRNRITGIIGTHPKPINHIYRGSVIRGIEVKLEVDETHFEYGAGDLHLFGRVLREFFALYASINSFVALKLVKPKTDKSEEEVLFEWTPEEVVNDKNREEFLTARKPTL